MQGYQHDRFQLGGYLLASQQHNSPIEPHDKGTLLYLVKDAVKGEPNGFAAEVVLDEMRPELEAAMDESCRIDHTTLQPLLPANYIGKKLKFPCGWCVYQDYCHE